MKQYIWILVVFISNWALGDPAVLAPLEPADTSSPRSTLNSFIINCDAVHEAMLYGGQQSETQEMIDVLLRKIVTCLDLRDFADYQRAHISKEATVYLKEVLDRIDLPEESEIPGREDIVFENGERLERWVIPQTEITLSLITEGPRKGQYLFSADSIRRSEEFYNNVKDYAYREGATEGFASLYLSSPGSPAAEAVVRLLPSQVRQRIFGQAIWQWVALFFVLLLTIMVMLVVYRVGKIVRGRPAKWNILRSFGSLIFLALAAFIPLLTKEIIAGDINITGQLLDILDFNLSLVALFAGSALLLGVSRRIGDLIISSPKMEGHSIDAQLVRLMSRIIGIIVAIAMILEGGRHLGIPLSTLLASAGVIGAALALSAQDVLKNIFGSIMIILDKPYEVGERIKLKGYDGVVEDIGLRSTKIRLFSGHLAVIPNEDMARVDVENVGRRKFIRRVENIPLPMQISSEKAEEAVAVILEVLDQHEGMHEDFPPRAWLDKLQRDHWNLRMIYWYHPPNYWDYTKHAQSVNTQIIKRFAEQGIKISLPAFEDIGTKGKILTAENSLNPKPSSDV